MSAFQPLATFVFWGGLALCAYIYVGFFALLWLLARLFGKQPHPDDSHTPSVSLLVSAYNEERVIADKLRNALALDYPAGALEILLVSDGSTDKTNEVAAGFIERGVKVLQYGERRGKNAALNDAIAEAHGDILVFTDANTMYEPDAVKMLARHFADPDVGLVVGSLNFVSDAGDQVDGGLYWRHENRLKRFQSALGSVLVANGSIFAARHELVGTLENDVANDFQTPMEIAARGFRILYEPEAVALEKSASDQTEEFARKIRIVNRGMTGTRKLIKHIRGRRLFLFLSHKLLRWLVGYIQAAVLLANIILAGTHPIYTLALVCQAVFYACAITGHAMRNRPHTPKALQIPFYLCMVNLAAIIASLRFITGRRTAIWEKAETAR